jgi:holo-[acyl-carrier protein] synthase
VDVVDVPRFASAITRHPRLVQRLFTEREQRDARARPERLAARFAAKEAVLKTLHVGIGATPWHSIEIHRSREGVPSVHLYGAALISPRSEALASCICQCRTRRSPRLPLSLAMT